MNCGDEIKRELNLRMSLEESGWPLSKNRNGAKWVEHTKMAIDTKWVGQRE